MEEKNTEDAAHHLVPWAWKPSINTFDGKQFSPQTVLRADFICF
jgi:hypothetical protein